ncbi:MAG TPA: DUF1822 family protein [Oscillatoriales cyanobacterium M59_W2019_021]|nr:MAG: DUF1822 family protein [Cyanobacteria bacterium J055]HIK32459.1 DUF1822 family protein [Oscillatoriales cyanobacterium M4454_W2019_049]HIK50218.1 DUF1822 family protein [Oscillatoriales cyanobacterium M59_W2019_021]
MTFTFDPVSFSVPLALAAHGQADRFRRYQKTPQKGKQVYLNTLAVYAVNFYLQCLGFETELETSDSWNPSLQTLMDVADLTVKPYGKIECRPVLPQATTICIPPEVWEGRISYIAVRLNASLREATLLGFLPSVQTREVSLTQLQDLDRLGQYWLQQHQNQGDRSVNLSQWLDNLFEAGWQTLDALLGSNAGNFAVALRSSSVDGQPIVQGAKSIDWGIEAGNRSAVLLVGLFPEAGNTSRGSRWRERWGIRVQLHPQPGNPYLLENLTLSLQSLEGETLREVTSGSSDNFIQLPRFKCDRGDSFTLVVRWGNHSVSQNFTV